MAHDGMFSGIIEATSPILVLEPGDQTLRLVMERPHEFSDIQLGDSIAVNGVCLTLESFDATTMSFSLGAESIKVLELSQPKKLLKVPVNLERSLKFGDRIHGHLVSGHVDFVAPVVKSEALGDNWILRVRLRDGLKTAVWKKGSLTLHGVSLTVNEVDGSEVEVCLIPETIKRTNLAQLKIGDLVNIEMDWMAKGLMQALEGQGLSAVLKMVKKDS